MGYQKLYCGVLLLCLVQMDSLAGNTVKKIYYHKKDQQPVVEPAQLSCYFDEEPTVDESTKALRNGSNQQTFIIKNSAIKDNKVIDSLREINNGAKKGEFSVVMAHDPRQQQLTITVTYNPKKIAVVWKIFDAITEDKGFMVHFYDRVMLQNLQNHQPPLVQLASTKKPRILVDCGHGGADTGGIGHNGLQEKDVCLQIGMIVTNLLKEQGMTVLLTRTGDLQVPLAERTYNAHPHNADLFVSIHANYGFNGNAQGIETFHLPHINCTNGVGCLTDQEKKSLHNIATHLLQQSTCLSKAIHHQVLASTRTFHETKDRGVKSKTSQLLSASGIPTTLVEVGFLSHHHEGRLLGQLHYQHAIAKGIVNGIMHYLSSFQSLIHA